MMSGAEGDVGETHTGGPGDRVGDRRGDGVDGGFALGFRSERADLVVRVGEVHFGGDDVGERRDAVVAQRRVEHRPTCVSGLHVLVERPAEALRDRAVDLAAALFLVDAHADVAAACAAASCKQRDLARYPVHCEIVSRAR